jgi:putative ABC transport system ATP-binding protein
MPLLGNKSSPNFPTWVKSRRVSPSFSGRNPLFWQESAPTLYALAMEKSLSTSPSQPIRGPVLFRARGLEKSFGPLQILQGLDFELSQGESVAILGASGSGKTTLLSVMAGLEPVDGGSLEFRDRELAGATQEELDAWRGQHVGLVFQNYHLIPSLTAWENAALPLEIQGQASAMDKAKELLARVGLENRLHHDPSRLSGGEQQRVALARALAADPTLLFADEPTGSLDESSAADVENLIFRLIREQGLAAAIVTHNRELARRCDRILHMRGGRLHTESTPEDIALTA